MDEHLETRPRGERRLGAAGRATNRTVARTPTAGADREEFLVLVAYLRDLAGRAPLDWRPARTGPPSPSEVACTALLDR